MFFAPLPGLAFGRLPGDGIGFWVLDAELFGRDDPHWNAMGRAERAAFRRDVAQAVVALYARERERGVSATGHRLKRLAESTIHNRRSAMGMADKTAPPLVPAHGLSRTVSLLRFEIRPRGIWFYWAVDPISGASWGRTLDLHRQGGGRLPKRDVIGVTLKLKREARDAALGRWAAVVDPDRRAPGRLGWLQRRLRELLSRTEAPPPVAPTLRARPSPTWRDRVDRAIAGMDDYSQAGTDRLRARDAARQRVGAGRRRP